MTGRFSALRLVATLAVVPLIAPSLPVRAEPPCQLCAVTSSTVTMAVTNSTEEPIRLEVQSRLDFDQIVFGGSGEALMDVSPDGSSRITGSAQTSGARAMPGSVVIRGEPNRPIRVDLPRQVQLFGDRGGVLRLESIVTSLPPFPRIGPDGTLDFRFGGELTVRGDQDGAFRGTIDITVEYL